MAKKKAVKKKTTKRGRGRPSGYKSEYCQVAIEALSKGYSKEAVAGHIGICKDTLYEWIDAHQEFSDAIKKGVELSRHFWEKTALDNLVHSKNSKQLNSTIWIFNMKNRFGWADKQEIKTETEDQNITVSLAYDPKEKKED